MTRKLSITLAVAALVLVGGTATLHAEEPPVDEPMVVEESPAEAFPVEIETGDLPTADEVLDSEAALGTPEPLAQRCICISYRASCESLCGPGNYDFDCYPTSHVNCQCLEGGGGYYQTCS